MLLRLIEITTTGANGSATGSVDTSFFEGERPVAVLVQRAGLGAPATTTVTVSFPDAPWLANIAFAAGATDVLRLPRVTPTAFDGTALTGAVPEPPPVYGRIHAAVGASNALSPAAVVRCVLAG